MSDQMTAFIIACYVIGFLLEVIQCVRDNRRLPEVGIPWYGVIVVSLLWPVFTLAEIIGSFKGPRE